MRTFRQCRSCGTQLAEDMAYCPTCGALLPRSGAAFGIVSDGPTEASPPPAPQAYKPATDYGSPPYGVPQQNPYEPLHPNYAPPPPSPRKVSRRTVLVGLTVGGALVVGGGGGLLWLKSSQQPVAPTALPSPTKEGGTSIMANVYRVVSVNSGKVLDVAGGSIQNGAQIIQSDYWGGANQHWIFEHLGNISGKDVYKITSQASRMALDVAGANLANGTKVIQYDYWGGANQLWYRVAVGDGSYKLQSVSSLRVLDVAGASKDNGAIIQIYDDLNGPNQHWRLIEV